MKTDLALESPSPAAFSPGLVEAGRKLFAQRAEFIWASPSIETLPPPGGLEIAFAGRSNVCKSSLVNALTGHNALARTSNTPGRTQELIFFTIGDALRLVDMPGYGYAAVSKQKSASWGRLIQDYLRGRTTLARAYVLIDGRHGIKDTDTGTLDLLDRSAVSYQIVLTKMDEVKAPLRAARLESASERLKKRPAAHPRVLATSSRSGGGISELRAAVAELLQERGALKI